MAKQTEETKKPTRVATKEFRDMDNFDQVWEVGDDVSHFAKDRLEKAVENGVVELVVDQEAIKAAEKAEADKIAADQKKAADEAKKAEADAKKAASAAAKAEAEAAKKAAESAGAQQASQTA